MPDSMSDFMNLSQAFSNLTGSIGQLINVKTQLQTENNWAKISKAQNDFIMRMNTAPDPKNPNNGAITSANYRQEFEAHQKNVQAFIDNIPDSVVRERVAGNLTQASQQFQMKVQESMAPIMIREAQADAFEIAASAPDSASAAGILKKFGPDGMGIWDSTQIGQVQSAILDPKIAQEAIAGYQAAGKQALQAALDAESEATYQADVAEWEARKKAVESENAATGAVPSAMIGAKEFTEPRPEMVRMEATESMPLERVRLLLQADQSIPPGARTVGLAMIDQRLDAGDAQIQAAANGIMPYLMENKIPPEQLRTLVRDIRTSDARSATKQSVVKGLETVAASNISSSLEQQYQAIVSNTPNSAFYSQDFILAAKESLRTLAMDDFAGDAETVAETRTKLIDKIDLLSKDASGMAAAEERVTIEMRQYVNNWKLAVKRERASTDAFLIAMRDGKKWVNPRTGQLVSPADYSVEFKTEMDKVVESSAEGQKANTSLDRMLSTESVGGISAANFQNDGSSYIKRAFQKVKDGKPDPEQAMFVSAVRSAVAAHYTTVTNPTDAQAKQWVVDAMTSAYSMVQAGVMTVKKDAFNKTDVSVAADMVAWFDTREARGMLVPQSGSAMPEIPQEMQAKYDAVWAAADATAKSNGITGTVSGYIDKDGRPFVTIDGVSYDVNSDAKKDNIVLVAPNGKSYTYIDMEAVSRAAKAAEQQAAFAGNYAGMSYGVGSPNK